MTGQRMVEPAVGHDGECAGGFPPFPPPPWDEAEEGRGERRDAVENRRRVLAAARELFAARGVDAVTMQEVARAAGIGQGTLYRRFAHKGQLCLALIADDVRALHAAVGARLADDDEPALDQLEFFLARLADFMERNAEFLAGAADAACGERRDAAHDNPFYGWQRGTVATLLDRAVARGEIAPLDTAPAADVVLAPLAIDLYLHLRHGRGYAPERILAAVRRVVFDGLRGQPRSSV